MITAQRVRTRASGVFFGWWIVAASAGIQMLQAGLLMQAYGAYVSVLTDAFGWSKTALSLGYSIQPVQSGILGPLQGWMIDHWGPKRVMRAGMIMFGGGFILFSQINSLPTFYATLVLMAVGSSLSGFMSITTTIVQWFERRRATAMSVSQTGMSVGGMIVPLVAISLTTFGWRETAFVSGIIVLVVGLPLTHVMRTNPEEYGLLPDGASPDAVRPVNGVVPVSFATSYDFTAKEALRTRAFWMISFGHATALLVVSAVMVHLVVHLEEDKGFTLSGAAIIVAVMTLVTAIGQVVGGILGDRFSKRLIAALAMSGHSVGLLVLAWGPSLFWVLVFTVLHGTAWGMRGPLMQAMRADYFGRRHFGTIMGFSSLIITWGMAGGPIIAGLMADRFGNYEYGFTLLAIIAGLGSIFFVFATKPEPPKTVLTEEFP